MPPKPTSAPQRVPVTNELVRHLTTAVKRHLLDNGAAPEVMNEEVIRSALRGFNAHASGRQPPAAR